MAQSGRSMVEMLGTLAIIGVLSIGGIAGYSYGMDKYKANQTINDITLRTVDLLTQAGQGRAELSFAEWEKENTIYDFSNPAYVDGENLIMFDVGANDKIPQRVCKMVFDGLANTAVQIDINAARADSGDTCGEDNTMTFYFEGGVVVTDGCKTDADCGEGRYCDVDTGICFNGTAPEGTYGECTTINECCPEGSLMSEKHGDNCTINTPNDGVCYYGDCLPKGCTYDENKCEGFGIYCASPNNSCTEAFRSGESGTCVEADFSKLNVGDKTYYVSHRFMSWWDGDAACRALGRDGLVEVDDIIIGWTKNDGKSHNFTALGEALQSHYGAGGGYVWTNNLTDGVDSCNAYYVGLDNGGVGSDARTSTNCPHAVCK